MGYLKLSDVYAYVTNKIILGNALFAIICALLPTDQIIGRMYFPAI